MDRWLRVNQVFGQNPFVVGNGHVLGGTRVVGQMAAADKALVPGELEVGLLLTISLYTWVDSKTGRVMWAIGLSVQLRQERKSAAGGSGGE